MIVMEIVHKVLQYYPRSSTVQSIDGTAETWTIDGCVDERCVEQYMHVYCNFAGCIANGGAYNRCSCDHFYKSRRISTKYRKLFYTGTTGCDPGNRELQDPCDTCSLSSFSVDNVAPHERAHLTYLKVLLYIFYTGTTLRGKL